MAFDDVVSSNSVLKEAIERVRADLDEPSTDAKFSDHYITRMILIPAATECMTAVNMQADNPVVFRMSFPITAGQEYYQLPPCVQQIIRLAKIDHDGNVVMERMPRGEFNPIGPGVALEGNTLAIRPFTDTTDSDWSLWYIPSGDIQMHYSQGGEINAGEDGADVLRIAATLGDTDVGTIDRRANAYVGQVLRLLPEDGVLQERIIDEHYLDTDNKWKIHVRMPFDPVPDDEENVAYEIVPFVASHFWVMVARKAVFDIGNSRNISDSNMRRKYLQYESAKKTVLDIFSNMNGRTGKYFQSVVQDNPRQNPNYFNQLMP
jgi:hypothetical protein